MTNIANTPAFFPRLISVYVPNMQYVGDVLDLDHLRLSFGPAAIISGGSQLIFPQTNVASPGTKTVAAGQFTIPITDTPWGRTCSASLASGVATGTLTIDGWDYLGQPMSEDLAISGTTVIQGKKAFKYFRQATWTAIASVNLNFAISNKLGLPYQCLKVSTEEFNSGPTTVGTLVAPDTTDPATSVTGDPRGTYTPNTVLDGVKVITGTFRMANDINAAGNGGLHGIAHFGNPF